MSRAAVALRLARRDLEQAPLRTALVLVMVALPVAAVTATDVLLWSERTPSGLQVPALPDGAEALVRAVPGTGDLVQDATGTSWSGSGGPPGPPLERARVLSALPAGSRLAAIEGGIAEVALDDGPGRVRAVLADLADPLLEGRFEVVEGRLPAADDEVAVSPALVGAGLELGSTTRGGNGQVLRVVGVLPPADPVEPALVGLTDALPLIPLPDAQPSEWLVDSPEPVDWDTVRELNAAGAVVTSRAVLQSEPAAADDRPTSSRGGPVVLLVVAMAVLEVVLLAGPAFAVSARRSRTALAQLAAAGGEPADGRRVVLAGALLLGAAAAVAGIAAGLGVAALLQGTVRTLGLDPAPGLPVVDLVVVFVVAVLSAVLAALAPALAAGRQDPMVALTARPDPLRPRRAPVIAGAVLLVLGVLSAAAAGLGGSEYTVTLAAVPTVLGAVLLAPAALVLAARACRPLPFVLRYPVRDAARQRLRTAPAVGAITAVVAAAVALGIGGASDAQQARAMEANSGFPPGTTAVVGSVPDDGVWERVAAAVRRTAPGVDVREVRGVRGSDGDRVVSVCVGAGCGLLVDGWGGSLGSAALVGPEALALLRLPDRSQALEALRSGGAVVLTDAAPTDEPTTHGPAEFTAGGRTVTAPAALVDLAGATAPVPMVLSEALAARLGLEVGPQALALLGPLDAATREAVERAIALRAPEASLSVPVAPTDEREDDLALLVLAGVAAVLVLGGVLTSTLLALHDARPELAMLGALGAAGGVRRGIAAGYAATLGLVGALLGALAGLVPGVAVAHPLTRGVSEDGLLPRYLDVPEGLVLLLVLGVPLFAAAVAALTAGGPLPRRARPALP